MPNGSEFSWADAINQPQPRLVGSLQLCQGRTIAAKYYYGLADAAKVHRMLWMMPSFRLVEHQMPKPRLGLRLRTYDMQGDYTLGEAMRAPTAALGNTYIDCAVQFLGFYCAVTVPANSCFVLSPSECI